MFFSYLLAPMCEFEMRRVPQTQDHLRRQCSHFCRRLSLSFAAPCNLFELPNRRSGHPLILPTLSSYLFSLPPHPIVLTTVPLVFAPFFSLPVNASLRFHLIYPILIVATSYFVHPSSLSSLFLFHPRFSSRFVFSFVSLFHCRTHFSRFFFLLSVSTV